MRRLPFVFALVLVCAATVRAQENQPEKVPESATWMVYLNIERPLASHVGDAVKQLLARKDLAAHVTEVENIFGVNFLRDIRAVTLFGVDKEDDKAVVYFRGALDVPRLTALARAGQNAGEVKHGERTIHHWLDTKRNRLAYGAFAQNDLLLIGGSELAVKGALDTLDGKATALVSAANIGTETFFYGAVSNLHLIKDANPQAGLLQEVKDLALVLDMAAEGVIASLQAEAKDEQAAENIKNVLEGMRGLALLNAKKDPKTAELAGKIQLTKELTRIRLALPVDTAQLVEWLKQQAVLPVEPKAPVAK